MRYPRSRARRNGPVPTLRESPTSRTRGGDVMASGAACSCGARRDVEPAVSAEARRTAASRTRERVARVPEAGLRATASSRGSVVARRRKPRLAVVLRFRDVESRSLDGRGEPGRIRRIPGAQSRERRVDRLSAPSCGASGGDLGERDEHPGDGHHADDLGDVELGDGGRRLRRRRGTRSRAGASARPAPAGTAHPGH